MLETINVIEVGPDGIIGLRAFPNTPEGNKQADKMFEKLVAENGFKGKGHMDIALDDGHFSIGDDYSVYIKVSSTK